MPSSLIGSFSGGSGTGTATAYAATLPTGITPTSAIVFSSSIGTNTTLTSVSIGSSSISPDVLASSPVSNGTNSQSYLWALQGAAAYSGQTLTVTWAATGRGGVVGGVWATTSTSSVNSISSSIGAASGTAPTTTDAGGITIEIGWARSGTVPNISVVLPGAYPSVVTYATSAATGIGVAGNLGSGSGAGGGSFTTSPAADKVTLFTVSLPASVTSGTGSLSRSGTGQLGLAGSVSAAVDFSGVGTLFQGVTEISVPNSNLIGTFDGGPGSGSAAAFSAVLPAGITSGSALIFSSASASNTTLSSITIGASAVSPFVVSGPDANGTNLNTYVWSLQGNPAYSGQTLTVTWAAVGKGGVVGAVWKNVNAASGSATLTSLTNGSSGNFPTIAPKAAPTLLFSWTRTALGASYLSSASNIVARYSTGSTTAVNVTGQLQFAGNGAAGGESFTTSPLSDKVVAYAAAFNGTASSSTADFSATGTLSTVGNPISATGYLGSFAGGSDAASNLAHSALLPSGIDATTSIIFCAAIGTNTTLAGVTVGGNSIAVSQLGTTVANGTNLQTAAWVLNGDPSYSGKTLTVTWAANGRGGVIGGAWRNTDPTKVSFLSAASSVATGLTAPVATDQGGVLVEFAWARSTTNVPIPVMPSSLTTDATYGTSGPTGYAVAGAMAYGKGSGGGALTSSPPGDKLTAFTVAIGSNASAPVVNAGSSVTVGAFQSVQLNATITGGTPPYSKRTWTQLSGDSVPVSGSGNAKTILETPGTLFGQTLQFQFSVQDAAGVTGASSVYINVLPAQFRAVLGGFEQVCKYLAAKVTNNTAPSLFWNVFPGGGGQSASAISPFDRNLMAIGTDTGGVRISADSTATTYINLVGFTPIRSKQSDGLMFSALDKGRLFMTCGDSTVNTGGVYVMTGADTGSPSPWIRLDGIANPTKLLFNGGNGLGTATPSVGGYPRHYGTIMEIDEVSAPGFTYLHLATTSQGAWRIKVNNTTLTAVEQIQYQGTAGAYVRCVKLAKYAPNPAQDGYSRLIISVYDRSAPVAPLLCTNANTTGTTLPTSVITGAPLNVEAIGYVKSSTGVPLTIFSGITFVKFSIDAFSATADKITFYEMTRTVAQNDGPENNTVTGWMSVGTTNQGDTYYVLVGTATGRKVNATTFNTLWRATVDGTNSATPTPWTTTSWKAIAGTTYWSEQVLNRPGVNNYWWLGGINTPGLTSGANISAFATSATDPARMLMTARGNSFISDDYGLHWYASRSFGSANHFSIVFDQFVNKTYFASVGGDWPLMSVCPPVGDKPFLTKEGKNLLDFSNMAASEAWFDPRTGELFFCGATVTTKGHEVDATGASNQVWSIKMANPGGTYPELDQTYSPFPGATDPVATPYPYYVNGYNYYTGTPGTQAGVKTGIVAYGPGASSPRTIIVGTMHGDGMWYTNNDGATQWKEIVASDGLSNPFSIGGGSVRGVAIYDNVRSCVYFMDREQGTVWRVSINASGVASTAVPIFKSSWAYLFSPESVGYIDVDVVNNVLWVSTLSEVYYIAGASSVTANRGLGNAQAIGFRDPNNYPGEQVGAMCFLPATGRVCVATLHFTGSQTQIYPINGTYGSRFLAITNPTNSTSWARATAEDWALTKDPSFKIGYVVPHGLARNWDGSVVTLSMQGNGVGAWFA